MMPHLGFHRIPQRFGVEGTVKAHLVQPPAMSSDVFNQIRLLRALSDLTMNIARDGASTTSLGNLCQCLATLIIEKFFLISSLNPPFFSLKLSPLVLLPQALLKTLSPSLFF